MYSDTMATHSIVLNYSDVDGKYEERKEFLQKNNSHFMISHLEKKTEASILNISMEIIIFNDHFLCHIKLRRMAI